MDRTLTTTPRRAEPRRVVRTHHSRESFGNRSIDPATVHGRAMDVEVAR